MSAVSPPQIIPRFSIHFGEFSMQTKLSGSAVWRIRCHISSRLSRWFQSWFKLRRERQFRSWKLAGYWKACQGMWMRKRQVRLCRNFEYILPSPIFFFLAVYVLMLTNCYVNERRNETEFLSMSLQNWRQRHPRRIWLRRKWLTLQFHCPNPNLARGNPKQKTERPWRKNSKPSHPWQSVPLRHPWSNFLSL